MQFPLLFEQRMRDLLGNGWSAFAQAMEADVPAKGLRINPLKAAREEVLALLGDTVTPTAFSPWGFRLESERKAGNDPLHHAGVYYRQEPSAMSAVTALAPCRGERVLDLCAAPGGKSTQIAAALAGEGLLWCNEYVRARATPLMQNLERCGVANAVVTSLDTAVLAEQLTDAFDAVLCDAPCSGEGMFRKEPEALAQWSIDNIALCAARQRTILDAAAKTVRPGGRLLYSTCTFAPEENEQNAAWFLQTHPEFEAGDLSALPFGQPAFAVADGFPTHAGRRILPQHGGEGHFLALFRRKGEGSPCCPPYLPPKKDNHAAEAAALYRALFFDEPQGHFVTVGETVRLLPPTMPATSLHLLSAGVAVADVCKNRLEPAHGVFATKKAEHCRSAISLPPDSPLLAAFLRGESIPCDSGLTGWTAVAVGNAVVGFGKAVNGTLKNRYPKGLRIH